MSIKGAICLGLGLGLVCAAGVCVGSKVMVDNSRKEIVLQKLPTPIGSCADDLPPILKASANGTIEYATCQTSVETRKRLWR